MIKSALQIIPLAAVVVLTASCQSLTKEERAAMEQNASVQYENLGKVYKSANKLIKDLHAGEVQMELGCDANQDPKSDPKSLNVFHIEELKKFTATTPEAFDQLQDEWLDSEWKWLSTSRYMLDDHMHALPTDLSDKDLGSLDYWMNADSWGTIFYDTEFAVIVPDPMDSLEFVMPELLDDERYASGYFNGWAIIYARDNFEPVCVRPFVVESSEQLSYKEYRGRRGGLINTLTGSGNPEKTLRDDFKDRFKRTLKIALKDYETRYFDGF